MTADGLRALAKFLPDFSAPDFKAGEFRGGDEGQPGVVQMAYVSYLPVVESFIETAYQHSWVQPRFMSPEWADTAEADSLRNDEAAISHATAEQLAYVLTFYIRGDRFCEGLILSAFASGLMLRIVKRAAALAADMPEPNRV